PRSCTGLRLHRPEFLRSPGRYSQDPAGATRCGGTTALCAGVPVAGTHPAPGTGYSGRSRTEQRYRTGECLGGGAPWPEGCVPDTQQCPEIPALPLPRHQRWPTSMNRSTKQPRIDWAQYMGSLAETSRQPLLAAFYQANWPTP